MALPAGSPIPQEVADELRRVARRWAQLPLGDALTRMPLTHELVQRLADRVAAGRDRPPTAVPDLGPAVVVHQLEVMVYDLFAADPDAEPAAITKALTGIRRAL